ncbi:MAG: FtsW/RodA/SpoVE family cell cycle protein [Eubacteriales bacterium]|nr:FtsW/RodA/SpoVE family cell cycle protein [Eubacteriales bacterium]
MNSFVKKIKTFFTKTDIFLWILTIAAVIYSLLLINSMQRSGDYNYMQSQVIAVVVGYVIAVFLTVFDYDKLLQLWWLFAIIGFSLLILVFFIGINVTGTDDTAWIRLPGGFSFQPSELVKIIFILTFTKHLVVLKNNDKLYSLLGFISLGIHVCIPILLVHLQGDDGTALVFAFMFIIMTFASGVQLRYFLIMLLLLCTAIPIFWNYVMNDEHKNRILALFDIDGNAMTNYGWQQYQGKVSIASGGMEGYGLNNGPRVATNIVPEQENDFIFTVAGEELGFIGCMLLLAILLLIMIKILLTCRKSADDSGKYICIGVFSMIASQTIINIAMVLGFMPVIGITLPFFSSGGTSILTVLISIGLVQSVYYHKDKLESSSIRLNKKYKISIKSY